jgi:hypothetical protein
LNWALNVRRFLGMIFGPPSPSYPFRPVPKNPPALHMACQPV